MTSLDLKDGVYKHSGAGETNECGRRETRISGKGGEERQSRSYMESRGGVAPFPLQPRTIPPDHVQERGDQVRAEGGVVVREVG